MALEYVATYKADYFAEKFGKGQLDWVKRGLCRTARYDLENDWVVVYKEVPPPPVFKEVPI